MDDAARSEKFLEMKMSGNTEATRKLRKAISELNRTEAINKEPFKKAILIEGPTGVGKEFTARTICAHWIWLRWSREEQDAYLGGNQVAARQLANELEDQFYVEPVTNLRGDVGFAELVGCRHGAFTGARESVGILGSKRTHILLDEIPYATPELQGQLLKIVQHRRRRPIGGGVDDESEVKARIIFAGNRPLADEVKRNGFREDLYFRMGSRLELPPLRGNRERIQELLSDLTTETLKRKICPERFIVQPTEADVAWAVGHPWPGNVRQLELTVDDWVSRTILDRQPVPLRDCLASSGDSRRSSDQLSHEAITLSMVIEHLKAEDRTYGSFGEIGEHFHGLFAKALFHVHKKGLVDQATLERCFGKKLKSAIDQARKYYDDKFETKL